jgi:hypothetical protein
MEPVFQPSVSVEVRPGLREWTIRVTWWSTAEQLLHLHPYGADLPPGQTKIGAKAGNVELWAATVSLSHHMFQQHIGLDKGNGSVSLSFSWSEASLEQLLAQ